MFSVFSRGRADNNLDTFSLSFRTVYPEIEPISKIDEIITVCFDRLIIIIIIKRKINFLSFLSIPRPESTFPNNSKFIFSKGKGKGRRSEAGPVAQFSSELT